MDAMFLITTSSANASSGIFSPSLLMPFFPSFDLDAHRTIQVCVAYGRQTNPRSYRIRFGLGTLLLGN